MSRRRIARPAAVSRENISNEIVNARPASDSPRRRLIIQAAQPDDLLSPAFVCSILGISRKTLYRMNRLTPPAIPIVRIGPTGKTFKYRRGAVEYYVSSHEIKATSAPRLQAIPRQTRKKSRAAMQRKPARDSKKNTHRAWKLKLTVRLNGVTLPGGSIRFVPPCDGGDGEKGRS